MNAEADAVSQVYQALKDLDAKLTEICDALDYPANFRSEAVRLINETRNMYSYRLNSEIPAIIQGYNPTTTPVMGA